MHFFRISKTLLKYRGKKKGPVAHKLIFYFQTILVICLIFYQLSGRVSCCDQITRSMIHSLEHSNSLHISIIKISLVYNQ